MLGPIARTATILPLAVLHFACSATREFAAGDPYANCEDLGDLSLLSYTQAAAAVTDTGQPAIVMTAAEAQEPDALETAEANAARRRSAAITSESIKPPAGELWFYGAALRCNKPEPLQ
jgi:hypothetical protein